MWSRFLLALGIVATMQAQQPGRNPVELLRLAQARVLEALDRLPRYMCTQTIDRALYDTPVPHRGAKCEDPMERRGAYLLGSDRQRFDVAMGATRDMYSWVGEARFSERDIVDIVPYGAASSGSFGSYLAGIFRSEDANVSYHGDTTEGGRQFSEFAFRVPSGRSHYAWVVGKQQVAVGYDGTFLVDSASGDLVRLVIRTSRLPAETGMCHAITTLDYSHSPIEGKDLLLPREVRFQVLHADGVEADNHGVFSSCREFAGKSRVMWEATSSGSDVSESRDPPSPALSPPPKTAFRVALTQAIDTSTAAAGDSLHGTLITPIEGIAPAGAPVTARIVHLRQYYGKDPYLSLGIRLETVNVHGIPVRFAADPVIAEAFKKKPKNGLFHRYGTAEWSYIDDQSYPFEFRQIVQPYLIPSGLESVWVAAGR